MPERPPTGLPDLGNFSEYKYWKPEAQQRALEILRDRTTQDWKPFFCRVKDCDGNPHDLWQWQHARADQRPPRWSDPWLTWVLKGGRGSGKTRTGAEVTHKIAEKVPRLYLIAPTGYDLRETMVEGMSGILSTSPPGKRPLWEPSKKKLTWPNGCIAQGFSAEEPDRLRGPAAGYVWADEPAHWPLVEACWSNMQFGLRVKGVKTKIVATSTPKPTKWMKELIADPKTITHTVSTYANLVNLSNEFADMILAKHEGTRVGRQELHGEILEDVEGALWQWEMIQWIDEAPESLTRIVVGVDPAGTTNKKSDETGIIVVGIDRAKNLYVIHDSTGKYSPDGWGTRAHGDAEDFAADAIVVERNFGEDMVKYVLQNSGLSGVRIKPVRSRRGKEIRAEPIVALYEKKRVFHVGKRGSLAALEDEMTTWVPGEGNSPNRVDALVHACTDLARISMPAQVADARKLGQITRPGQRHLRAI